LTAIVIAVLYFVILILVIGFIAKRKVKNASDFTKASHGLGWITMAFAFTLIPLGSGHTLSLWETAPSLGASVMWWGIVTGGIFLPLMMLWLGPLVRQSGCNTVPEILEGVIGKTFGRLNAGINIATWTGIGASETLATATAIYGLAGGNLAFTWCILIALVLIVLYVLVGGMLQMAWLNIINAIVMIVGSYLGMFLLTGWLAANIGGWEGIKGLYESWGQVDMLKTYDLGNSGMWFQVIIPVAVLHITAGAVGQNMNGPFFAARSDEDCRKGVFLGAFFNIASSVPWIVMSLIAAAILKSDSAGLLANLVGDANAAKLGPIELALTALPTPIVGLLMVSLLCATLSTGGATVLANANILVNDIFKKALKPDMSEKTRFTLMRVGVIICALLFAVPAFLNAVIFPIFLWCFSFGIPVFIIYIMGLKVRINKKAAWITIIVAYAVNFFWTFAMPGIPPLAAWAGGIFGGAFSLNMYPVVIISLILGIILPFVIPGGEPPFLKTNKMTDTERLAE
jgi:SSS family solute:Na+ symporter